MNETAEVCRYCGTHAEGDPSVPCPLAADLAAALAADEAEDAPAVVNPDGTPTAATLAFFGATRRQCDLCPFESSDPDAIRGHAAGPSSGRGWFGEGERHTMR